jgi:hypothetical protein
MATPQAAAGAAKGGDTGAALACATLAQLRPGAVRYDLSVPAQLLHPASALQLYGALLGAPRIATACTKHAELSSSGGRCHPVALTTSAARSTASARAP